MVAQGWCVFWLDTWEQIRVITNLSQLDKNVLIVTGGAAFLNGRFLQQLTVDWFLGLRDTNLDMHLDLWQQRFLDLPLDSSEHEWPQNLVKFFDDFVVLEFSLLISEALVGFTSKIKPFVEVVWRGEDLWQQEVQQTPQLMEVVLQWCTSQQQSVLWFQLPDSFRCLRIFIFNFMCFVNYNVLPLELWKSTHTNSNGLKSCNANIEFTWL